MKLLLEQNFKSEFDLSNEEYVFGHEDGQQEIISPYRLLVDFNNQKKHTLSDLFYNNLEIPKFWSIYPTGIRWRNNVSWREKSRYLF